MRQTDDTPPFSLKAAIAAQLKAAQDAVDSQGNTHAVHDARIALKRMRALARLAEAATHGSGKPLNIAARAAMDVLADARNLTALEAAARDAELDEVADHLLVAREGADVAALNQARDVLAAIGLLVAEFEDVAPDAVSAAAKRMEKRAKKAFANANGHRKTKPRHTWRKREKDRQNAELLLDGAWPHKLPHRRNTSRKLTDALGEERDAALLIARLKKDPELAGDEDKAKTAISALKKRRKQFAKQADTLGRKLHQR